MIELYNGDCLELMKKIPDKSVDLILCDLPYGTTHCKWDVIIPFDELWAQYKRIRKNDNTPTVLFGTMPFICKLWESNPREYRHEWIWQKSRSASAITAKYGPVRIHENILVFSKKKPNYYPIMEEGKPYSREPAPIQANDNQINFSSNKKTVNTGTRYPKSIKPFKQNWQRQSQIHPAQKPVELLEYLIKTYSKEGDVVLDNCMGSGSTGVACINTNRNFIGMELDGKHFEVAKKRIMKYE